MKEANKFRLGLFVLLGVILFLGCLFLFGLSDMFSKKVRFVSLFRESVQGLNIGSSVKYKGVPVGSVSKISILVDQQLIMVEMDLDLEFFKSSMGQVPGNAVEKFYRFCRWQRKRGLRCRLEFAGITGLKFVEIDYFAKPNTAVNIERPNYLSKNYFYIPSAPGVINNMLKLVNDSLHKIAKIDFTNIASDARAMFAEMKRIVTDPKLRKAIDQLAAMSGNLEKSTSVFSKVFTKERLDKALTKVNSSLNSLDGLAKRITEQVGESKFPETARAFREVADSINSTKGALENTFMRLDQTIDALNELINYLNDDPSSLLKGKEKAKIQFPKDETNN